MQMSFSEMGVFLTEGAQRVGCDELTYLKCQIDGEKARLAKLATERQVHEEIRIARHAVEPMLMEIYRTNGEIAGGRFDNRDICERLGLPATQGNRMWASRKLLEFSRKDQHAHTHAASHEQTPVT